MNHKKIHSSHLFKVNNINIMSTKFREACLNQKFMLETIYHKLLGKLLIEHLNE